MINIVKPYLPPKDVLIPELEKVLYSGFIAQGEKVEEFEEMLKEYFDTKNLLSVNSGTAGLHIALNLLNINKGDEVISTPMTAEPTNTSIIQTGAKIVWADVEPETGLICPESVKKLITKKTKAIMIVHYAGMVANMDEFYKIRSEYNIPIIEDCAHAFGAEYKNKKIGYFSDFAVYSFQAIKHLTTVDGGLLIINSQDKYVRAKKMRWFGLDKTITRLENDISEIGYKYNMNDVNATIGIIQLKYLLSNTEIYINNGLYFDEKLDGVIGLRKINYHKNSKPAYWLYTSLVDRRVDFIKHMNSNGITCSPLHLRNDRHSIFPNGNHLTGLNSFYENFVHWGCGWWIDNQDRKHIVNSIKKGW